MGAAHAEEAGEGRPTFERFGRRAIETFLGFSLSTGANGIFFLLLARTLGSGGTGVVSVAILLASATTFVVSIALILPNTYFGAREPRSRGALLANSLIFAATVGTVVATLLYAVFEATGVTFGMTGYELAAVLAAVPFISGGRLIQSLVVASGRSRTFNLLTTLGPILTLTSVAVGFLAVETSVTVALVSYWISQFCLFAVCFVVGAIRVARPSRPLLRASLRYGFRGMVGNLIQLFNYRFDLFLVSSLKGPSAAGIYSAAVFLAELLWKISAAASTILFPRVAADDDAPVAFTLRVGRVVVLATTAGAIVLVPVSAWIVLPLLEHDFSSALTPLVLLLPGVVALSLTSILASDLAGRGTPQYASYAAAIGFAITLSVNFALIPRYGASGAAVTSTLAYGASTAFVATVVIRRFGVRVRDLVLPRRHDLPAILHRPATRSHA